MQKKFHIVFTTIFNADLILESLLENIRFHGHLDEVKIWIVGDRKTPSSVGEKAGELTLQGLETIYLDIQSQDNWGKKLPEFYRCIPYDNETRRNIGYLHALEDGCGVLISIDDDNFPVNSDFINGHSIVGELWEGSLIKEPTGFHNVCEYMEFSPPRPIYPRGYPFIHRGKKNEGGSVESLRPIKIGLNAGLWLQEPDVDATTWLNGKIISTSYTGSKYQALDQSTWTPINTQNTSVVRDLMAAYFCIPMGWTMPGGSLQRYGDIWGGYFFQALIKGMPYAIAFGEPMVEHRRNPHNYVDDLRFEYWGMILTDWMIDELRNRYVGGSASVLENLDELTVFIRESTERLPSWCTGEMGKFLIATSTNLFHWIGAVRLIEGCH